MSCVKNSLMQCGRSMLEMLCVLAVMGVLSAGAFAGYSSAIANHKANIAAGELNMFFNEIMLLKDEGVNIRVFGRGLSSFFVQRGVYPSDGINVLGASMRMKPGRNDTLYLIYPFPGLGDRMCVNMLLNGGYNELGSSFFHSMLVMGGVYTSFSDDPNLSNSYPFPITAERATAACQNFQGIQFSINL